MKRLCLVLFAVVISIAFVTSVFAQSATEKATKAATDTATEKAKAAGDAMKDKATKAGTEKAAPAPQKAAPAPAPEKKAEKKSAAKVQMHQYTGEVTAMDMAAKTLTVKGKKGDMTFDVADVKMKSEAKAGDKATVKYMEKDGKMVAKSVMTTGAKKAEKKTAKPAEKPMAPAKPAAPAPAPAK